MAHGARLPKCGSEQMNREMPKGLSQELRKVLDPLLAEIESLNGMPDALWGCVPVAGTLG
jgi:hypothetical protein